MKKCYKFIVDKWTDKSSAKTYRGIVKDWIKSDGVDGKATIYVHDDAYIYATDPNVVHLVLTDPTRWKDLPSTLSEYGEDILDAIIDIIDTRDDEDPAIAAQEDLLDYLING